MGYHSLIVHLDDNLGHKAIKRRVSAVREGAEGIREHPCRSRVSAQSLIRNRDGALSPAPPFPPSPSPTPFFHNVDVDTSCEQVVTVPVPVDACMAEVPTRVGDNVLDVLPESLVSALESILAKGRAILDALGFEPCRAAVVSTVCDRHNSSESQKALLPSLRPT
jgi:hypothetical protein